jgi:hypothetical protein
MHNDRLIKPRTRRDFLKLAGLTAVNLGMSNASPLESAKAPEPDAALPPSTASRDLNTLTLFLCGDVMTGRGIDQVLPHPSRPEIFEPYMASAQGYMKLAEKVNGPIPAPVDFSYIWGDALEEFRIALPDARIINLETAVTTRSGFWPGKGIN